MFQVNKYKTGGGPEVDSKLDEIDLRAIEVCKGQFDPLPNNFDDDAGFHTTAWFPQEDSEQMVRISLFIYYSLRLVCQIFTIRMRGFWNN